MIRNPSQRNRKEQSMKEKSVKRWSVTRIQGLRLTKVHQHRKDSIMESIRLSLQKSKEQFYGDFTVMCNS